MISPDDFCHYYFISAAGLWTKCVLVFINLTLGLSSLKLRIPPIPHYFWACVFLFLLTSRTSSRLYDLTHPVRPWISTAPPSPWCLSTWWPSRMGRGGPWHAGGLEIWYAYNKNGKKSLIFLKVFFFKELFLKNLSFHYYHWLCKHSYIYYVGFL